MIKTLALFGEHIEQSYSPQFHQHFAKQFNINIDYQKITVTQESFPSAWEHFVDNNGIGANITMPCKHQAFQLCTKTSERAQKSASVNTIRIDSKNEWYGDNTDGVGFVRDLVDYYGHELKQKNILILGAGSAASGILYSIIEQLPNTILVANRTLTRAQQLTLRYPQIRACDFVNIPSSEFDVVINAAADLPLAELKIKLASKSVAYDLRYTPKAQEFLEWARFHNAENTYDGYGMLLEQAASAFGVWFDRAPDTKELRK